jgi:hypothetical protein
MKTLIVSKTALTVATVAFGAALSLPAAVIDFSTDPNLAGDWTEHDYFAPGLEDNVAASWNATDQDLDFVSTADTGGGTSIIGLYSTSDHTRSATESVTMTVNALDRTDGNWGFLGLMISADPLEHNYLAGTTDSYTLRMNAATDGTFQFAVWRTYADGAAGAALFTDTTSQTFSGSYVLDIERNGAGEYEFFANNVSLYTTTDATTGDDFYDATAKDSLLNYQMIMGGDGAMAATVDNFGIIPEPGTYALLGGLFALSFVMVRRR